MNVELKIPSPKEMHTLLPLVCEFHKVEGVDLTDKQRETSLQILLSTKELGGIWLIDYDGQIIGYIALCSGYSIEFGGKDAFIDEFYIKPEFRGQGLGKQTLKLIKAIAKEQGIQALHLEVNRQNHQVRKLYTDLDFETRQKYVLMSVKL